MQVLIILRQWRQTYQLVAWFTSASKATRLIYAQLITMSQALSTFIHIFTCMAISFISWMQYQQIGMCDPWDILERWDILEKCELQSSSPHSVSLFATLTYAAEILIQSLTAFPSISYKHSRVWPPGQIRPQHTLIQIHGKKMIAKTIM